MSSFTYYNKSIRRMTAAFASLFNNIILIRENTDGTENQRIVVPIEFADKEKYVKRLQNDPDLDKKNQITLPRMSYEFIGLRYDSTRKLNTNNKNYNVSPEDKVFFQYNPVPYDFDFSLTLYTRNIEDGNQILEQIIPYFTPDYTIKVNMVPEMNIIRNIPFTLNSIDPSIDSDGLFNSEVRTVYWNLKFTAKGYIFGAVKETNIGLIKSVTINFNDFNLSAGLLFSNTGIGDFQTNEIIYQGLNLDYSHFSAKVVNWNPVTNNMIITQQKGNLIFNQPILGSDSLAIRSPISYTSNSLLETLIVKVDPMSANSKSKDWKANVQIISYTNEANVNFNEINSVVY